MKKIVILSCIGLFMLSCVEKKKDSAIVSGKTIYLKNCLVCHGLDGKLGANGSKDLTKSTLTIDQRKTIITKGKGAMMALGGILNPEEVQAVAEYTFTFKK